MRIHLSPKVRKAQRQKHEESMQEQRDEFFDAEVAFQRQVNDICGAVNEELDFLREQLLRLALYTDLQNTDYWQTISYMLTALQDIHKKLVDYHGVKDSVALDTKV